MRRAAKPVIKEDTFGRPGDSPLQILFMKKLRQVKLKVIHAESEAEIECFQNSDSKAYLSNGASKGQKNKNYALEKINLIREIFERHDKARFRDLYKSFKSSAETWEFKEISSQADFPEFLFCDECDLSYVLYSCLYSEHEHFKAKIFFKGDELFFFQLICFAARDQISFKIIKTIEQYFDQIIEQMQGINDKVSHHFSQTHNQEQLKIQNATDDLNLAAICDIPSHLKRGQLRHSLNDFHQDSNSADPEKTKQIAKQKKRGRPKRGQIRLVQIQTIIHKLMVHIAWAYRYIYPAIIRKRHELE